MPGNVLMKIEGGEELRKALRKVESEFLAEMSAALPVEAQKLMDSSNTMAPRVSGELVGSSVVSSTEVKRGKVKAAAAYEDEKAPAVHEGIHYGEFRPGTRGFKWFERALNAFEGGFIERIATRLRRVAGG